jgi:hypothetical protein
MKPSLSLHFAPLFWKSVFFSRKQLALWDHYYFIFWAEDMRGQYFFIEPVFLDHNFKVNVNIFSTCQIIGFFLLLFPLQILHLYSPLLSFLLNAFNLIERVALFVLVSSFHIRIYMKIQINAIL